MYVYIYIFMQAPKLHGRVFTITDLKIVKP